MFSPSIVSHQFAAKRKIPTPPIKVRHPKSGLICAFDPDWGTFTFNNNKSKRMLSVSKILSKFFPFDADGVAEKLSKSQMRPVSEIKEEWKKSMILGKNVGNHFKAAFYSKKKNSSSSSSLSSTSTTDGEEENTCSSSGIASLVANYHKNSNNNGQQQQGEKSSTTSQFGKKNEILELHGDEEQYYRAATKAVDLISQKYEIIADDVIICSPPGNYSFSTNIHANNKNIATIDNEGENELKYDEESILAPSLGLNLGTKIDYLCRNKQNGKICILRVSTTTSTLSSFRFGTFDERVPLSPLDHLPNTRMSKFALEVLLSGLMLRDEGYARFFGKEIDALNGIEYGVVQFGKSDSYIDISFDLTKIEEDSLLPSLGIRSTNNNCGGGGAILGEMSSKSLLIEAVRAASASMTV